jgi:hypothetical protein
MIATAIITLPIVILDFRMGSFYWSFVKRIGKLTAGMTGA